MRLRDALTSHGAEWILLALVMLSVLWKGGKTLEMTWLLALVACVLVCTDVWRKRNEKTVVPALPWITGMLFLGWTVASFILSTTQNYGLDEVLRDTSLFLIFLWSVRKSLSSGGEAWERRAVTAIVTAALIACVVGVAVYTLQPVNRFVGTFTDPRFASDYWPNAWAEFLLLALPLAVVWTKGKSIAMRIIIPGIVLGCLFLSYSRGAFLCAVGEVLLLICITSIRWWRSAQRSIDWKTMLALIGGIGLTAIVTFSTVNYARLQFHPVESIAAKATFTASEGTSSISERQQFWDAAWQLSWERPLFGWGPYSFRFIQPRLQEQVFATSDHPHNVFLKLAMERGWPAAILFSLLLLLILVPAGVYVLMDRTHTQRTTLRIALCIGVLGVLVHNQIDYNLQFVGMALPFWIALGCLGVMDKSKLRIPQSIARIPEILVSVLLLIVLVLEGRMLVLSSLGRHAEAAGNTEAALQWYDKAQSQIFSRDMELSAASLEINTANGSDEGLARADVWLALAARKNVEDARLWKLQGDVQLADGKLADALHLYDRALALGRYNYLGSTTAVVRVLQWMGDGIALRERREEFMETYARFGEAIMMNAHFIALSDTPEQFAELSGLLQAQYPQDAELIAAAERMVLAKTQSLREELGGQRRGVLW